MATHRIDVSVAILTSFLMTPAEARTRPLTAAPSGVEKIAFHSNRDGSTQIHLMNTDGSGVQRLTNNCAADVGPAISPDGKTILCASVSEIWILGADGRDPRRLAKTTGMMVAYPRWAPDGRKIVFGMVVGVPPNHKTDIFTMNADGTGETALTRSEGINEYPCWSPDGKSIAFQTARDGNFEIYVMSSDGGNPWRLTSHPAMDGRPSWGK